METNNSTKGIESLRKKISVLEALLNEAREDLKRLLLLPEQEIPFSSEIKFIRASLGMSQKQLAKALNTTNSTVCRWESGKSMPHAKCFIVLNKLVADSHNLNFGPNELETPLITRDLLASALLQKGKTNEKQMKKEISSEIKAVRTALRMSQRQLADVLNIKQSTVYKWELGKTIPRAKNLIALQKLALDNGLGLIFTLDPR